MRIAKAIAILALACGVLLAAEKPAAPKTTALTDLMSRDEFAACGLQKLDPKELAALNGWMAKTIGALLTPAPANAEPTQVTIYDKFGNAAAYVDLKDDATVYLWDGDPVAYAKGTTIFWAT